MRIRTQGSFIPFVGVGFACLVALHGLACRGPGGAASAEQGPEPPEPLSDAPEGGPAQTIIRVHYPAGQRLSLRGDQPPLSWQRGLPLEQVAPGLYEMRLPALGGPVQFKPLLDDAIWSRGRNYHVLPGQVAEIYPHFWNERGSWSRRWPRVRSDLLGNERGVWVYLPPGYDENPLARYPVLYMHDGQNLFDPRAAFLGVTWRVAETLDRGSGALDPAEHIPEIIVVGAENAGPQRLYEYTPTEGGRGGGGGDLYLRFLVEELKPRVDSELRTRPDRSALCGSSLGGLISAYAGLRHPHVFRRIALLSPSTWWDNRYIIGAVLASRDRWPRPERVYLDSGDAGPGRDDVDNTTLLAQAYRDIGYRDGHDLLHVIQPGALHNEAFWAERLPGALRFLLAGW
ncbi:MAG: alpha/beta hydrolase-fold protein [Myxococcota bacterium]|nr:alpha/beta hydrolase-fold protein [Myxococcota bacterium]